MSLRGSALSTGAVSAAIPAYVSGGPQLLFKLTNANMAVTTDQQFTKIGTFTNYVISEVITKRVSGAYGVACLGGIYTAASKAGDALIAATQTYIALSGAGTVIKDTLAAILGLNFYTATPYLSLTTGNTGALVADVYIFGYPVD